MPLTPKGYTTKAEVEDFLFATLDPAYDAALDDLIAKAEAFIERSTRRRFDQPAGPLTVGVPGDGREVIVIPDTRSLTKVTVDGLVEQGTHEMTKEDFDWTLEPANAEDNGRPFTRLRLLGGTLLGRRRLLPETFPYPGKVTLEGTFGWDEVPAEIRMATTMLVGEATRRWRDGLAGDVSSYSLGDYSVTFNSTAGSGHDARGGNQFRRWVRPYIKPRVR